MKGGYNNLTLNKAGKVVIDKKYIKKISIDNEIEYLQIVINISKPEKIKRQRVSVYFLKRIKK